ncbi:MAG: 50S ribosomal protein L18a [Euryarchaeota archaeon]|nr:50S ribosomal protein L18a [Euryarchaeota archaeon]
MGHKTSNFKIEAVAADEKAAREWVYSVLGSKHGINRRVVTITDVKQIKVEDATDPIAAAKERMASGGKISPPKRAP